MCYCTGACMGFISEEDIYTEEEQYADWVDKMIRAAEAEGGEVERSDRS